MAKLLLLQSINGNEFVVPDRVQGFPAFFEAFGAPQPVDNTFINNGNIYQLLTFSLLYSNMPPNDLLTQGIPILNSGRYTTLIPFNYLTFIQTN